MQFGHLSGDISGWNGVADPLLRDLRQKPITAQGPPATLQYHTKIEESKPPVRCSQSTAGGLASGRLRAVRSNQPVIPLMRCESGGVLPWALVDRIVAELSRFRAQGNEMLHIDPSNELSTSNKRNENTIRQSRC